MFTLFKPRVQHPQCGCVPINAVVHSHLTWESMAIKLFCRAIKGQVLMGVFFVLLGPCKKGFQVRNQKLLVQLLKHHD